MNRSWLAWWLLALASACTSPNPLFQVSTKTVAPDAGPADETPPEWPSDGPVIIPRTNIDASLAPGAQSEADIAIDPTNAPFFNHLLAASNDRATGQVSVYESNDGATTWVTHKLLPPVGSLVATTGHASVAFDTHGNGLVSLIAYDAAGDGNVAISRRLAGSGSFSRPVMLAHGSADRQRMVVDRSAFSPRVNTVYLAWSDKQKLHVASSSDGGVSFGAAARVMDVGAATSPYPMVAGDGTLYVAWLDPNRAQLRIDRSGDGGATWDGDHLIHQLVATGVAAATRASPKAGARLAPFCDVDRSNGSGRGTVYCVYHDLAGDNGLDVFVRRSADGGATWSAPRRLNDDPAGTSADQFLPRVQVDDGNSKVSVAWYDTRDDPAHDKTQVYFTRANDGVSFVPSVRVTTASSDESRVGADPDGYGESLGMEAFNGRARLLWTDTRTGDEELFSCIIDFAHFNFFFAGSDTLTMGAGGSAPLGVTVEPVGPFVAAVQLSLLELPTGASGSFSVNPVLPGSTTVVTVTTGSAQAGTYTIALKGKGGGEEDSRSLVLVIQ